MLAVLVTLVIAAGGGWYAVTGYVARYKRCRRCNGLGFEPSRGIFSSSSYRMCRRCQGYGHVPRAAARHVARRRQQAGKRARRAVYRG